MPALLADAVNVTLSPIRTLVGGEDGFVEHETVGHENVLQDWLVDVVVHAPPPE